MSPPKRKLSTASVSDGSASKKGKGDAGADDTGTGGKIEQLTKPSEVLFGIDQAAAEAILKKYKFEERKVFLSGIAKGCNKPAHNLYNNPSYPDETAEDAEDFRTNLYDCLEDYPVDENNHYSHPRHDNLEGFPIVLDQHIAKERIGVGIFSHNKQGASTSASAAKKAVGTVEDQKEAAKERNKAEKEAYLALWRVKLLEYEDKIQNNKRVPNS